MKTDLEFRIACFKFHMKEKFLEKETFLEKIMVEFYKDKIGISIKDENFSEKIKY